MASEAYGVKLDGELDDRFQQYLDDHEGMSQSESHRRLLDEGLRSVGYTPAYRDASERFLELLRGIASVFGLVALILIGLNVVVPLSMQLGWYGFAMAVVSMATYVSVEIADRHGQAMYRWMVEQVRKETKQWTGEGASK